MDGEVERVDVAFKSCWGIGKKHSWDFFEASGGGSLRVFDGDISSGLGGTLEKKLRGLSSGLTGDRASFAGVAGTTIGSGRSRNLKAAWASPSSPGEDIEFMINFEALELLKSSVRGMAVFNAVRRGPQSGRVYVSREIFRPSPNHERS